MSKNIVIQEGGVGRQFTAQKLVTPLVEGGSCNWVPEDEVQLETKYISKNGTYIAADDNCYGYDKVVVNIVGMSKVITGTDNDGNPIIIDVDPDGNITEINRGDHWVFTRDDEGKVTDITDQDGNECTPIVDIEGNITGFTDNDGNNYIVNTDDEGNITSVINPDGSECGLKDIDGDGIADIVTDGDTFTVENTDDGIKIIDSQDSDVTSSFDGTTISGTDSGGSPWRVDVNSGSSGSGGKITTTPTTPATTPGASIAGIDATTGNETIATVDNNGNIKVEELPSSIKITFPPTQVDYIDGTAIDYSGMIVTAYKNDGHKWTDANHPNGIIPINELILSETRADINKSTISKGTRTLDGVSVEVTKSLQVTQYVDGKLNRSSVNTCPDGVLIILPPGNGRWVAISDTYDTATHYSNSQDGEYRYSEAQRGQQGFNAVDHELGISSVTGNPIYYGLVRGYDWSDNDIWSVTSSPELSRCTGVDNVMAADIALHGKGVIGGGETIPVAWRRPGDAFEMQDSFQITVVEYVTSDD